MCLRPLNMWSLLDCSVLANISKARICSHKQQEFRGSGLCSFSPVYLHTPKYPENYDCIHQQTRSYYLADSVLTITLYVEVMFPGK